MALIVQVGVPAEGWGRRQRRRHVWRHGRRGGGRRHQAQRPALDTIGLGGGDGRLMCLLRLLPRLLPRGLVGVLCGVLELCPVSMGAEAATELE